MKSATSRITCRMLLALVAGWSAVAGVRADPGSWERVGEAGAWKPTIVGAVLKGKLYTVETNGGLWETDLGTGTWKQLGKAEFGSTRFLLAAGNNLYTIETDGNLYRVNPNDGSWVGVGPAGAWKPTIAGAVLKGKLYTVENNNGLWETDLNTGGWSQLGKPEFGATRFMFAAGDHLYTIEEDGSLYRVSVK